MTTIMVSTSDVAYLALRHLCAAVTSKPQPGDTMCSVCHILEQAREGNIDQRMLAELASVRRGVDVEEGTELFTEGEAIDGIYCIHTGRVALMKRGGDGHDHLLCIATAGDLLGVPGILAGACHDNMAETLEHTSACFVPRAAFLTIAQRCPALLMRAMRQVCRQITMLEARAV